MKHLTSAVVPVTRLAKSTPPTKSGSPPVYDVAPRKRRGAN
jgi:hypothetical protein